MRNPNLLFPRLAILLLLMPLGSTLPGQDVDQFQDPLKDLVSGFDQGLDGEKVSCSAYFTVDDSGKTGTLYVTAEMALNWHVYSVTQQSGGPKPTVIRLGDGFKSASLTGPWQPDSEPEIKLDNKIFKMEVEKHYAAVTWSAPLTFADGVDASKLEIPVEIDGQTCQTMLDGETGQCLQFDDQLVAKAKAKARTETFEFRPENAHATVRGWIEPRATRPGETATLFLQLEPDSQWRVFGYSDRVTASLNSTLIALTTKHDATVLEPSASQEPEMIEVDGRELTVHWQAVTWSLPIELPKKIEPDTYQFAGTIGFQTAQASAEDEPVAVNFTVDLQVGSDVDEAKANLTFSQPPTADYGNLARQILRANQASALSAGQFANLPIPAVMGLAFLAGLILNIMPCVLPVIGLKILSFVQQGGENPRRILMLNLTFAAGMLLVFLILATLAVFFSVGWGGMFQSFAFKVTMIAIVFAFGLSFLGVWEIPIPGFVVSGSAGKAAEKEGYGGAFSKGILTTMLATPCSGPLIIPAVTWAMAQPPVLTYAAFTALGLGMAFPYIVIGAVPKLVNFLPKPGAWMETFKQLMGFVMLGTAVFLFGAISQKYAVPVLSLLIFVGLACWIVGRISLTSPFGQRAAGWVKATVVVGFGVFFGFYLLIPQHELDWKPFSQAALDEAIDEGQTVFVDFTADW